MIELDRQAPPYLVASAALGCASVLCLFKGINSYVNLVHKTSAVSNKKRFQKVFELFGWMGVTLLTGYGFYRTQLGFLDVKTFQYNKDSLKPFAKDLHDYENLYQFVFSEKSTLRNFCLAGLQSSTAYKVLDDLEGSKLQIRQDPRFYTARSAIRVVEQLKQEAAVLKSELVKREVRSKENFELLKGELSNRTLAKGVHMDYTRICETPFRHLVSSVCSPYLEHKSYLNKYAQYHRLLRDYTLDIVNERQFERCQKTYNFNGELDGLSSEEKVNQLEHSKETRIRRFLRYFFG